ncbi:hypothetical protein EDB84DRAFT_1579057 [Lactarius hengduanensis]|nr:hypothetical protein EDB84DRAFT_1579057 [Lactarius hengduanensis]
MLDSLQSSTSSPIPLFPHQYQSRLSIACLCATSSYLSPDTPNAVSKQTDGSATLRVKPEVAEHDESSPLGLSAEHQIPSLAGGWYAFRFLRQIVAAQTLPPGSLATAELALKMHP